MHNVQSDTTSILNDLAQLRAVRTNPPNDMSAGVTDVKLFRVAAWGTAGHVAAHFNSSSTSSGIDAVTNKASNYVSLYPTIVNHNYTVMYNLPVSGTTNITVFDMYGRQVLEQSIQDSEGGHQLTYLADGLSSGTYFFRLQSSTVVETKKFIVIH